MSATYLHGVEVVDNPLSAPPISTISTSIIGLIGTADKGGDGSTTAPINTATLITSLGQGIDVFGTSGTIHQGLTAIFNQTSALVVVVNVGISGSAADVASADPNHGANVFLQSSSVTGYTPKILTAPGFNDNTSDATMVAGALSTVSDHLRAIAVLDAFGTDVASAKSYVTGLSVGSPDRVYMVFPKVKDLSGNPQPASPYVAGLIAKSDSQRGFWWSPSNYGISGIQGTQIPISFTLGSTTCDANVLNEGKLATIILQNGSRLWGDRTCSGDATWQFLSVRRIADTIDESLLRAHLWAVDQNITRNYIDTIESSVNSYLRSLKALGAIIDGKCWADQHLNTVDNIKNGHIYFDFDFTPPYPAEHITFSSELVDTYLKEVFS